MRPAIRTRMVFRGLEKISAEIKKAGFYRRTPLRLFRASLDASISPTERSDAAIESRSIRGIFGKMTAKCLEQKLNKNHSKG
jgi:hypothetical protein